MDATALRVGQNNGSGDAFANFLEVYGGEVLTAFERKTVTKGRHMERQIASGKSAQFPATWRLNASYHVPGQEITGQSSNASERTISIDQKLISDVFIPDVDEAMAHFDYRSIYSTEAGRALARTFDTNVMRMLIKAAGASATVTGANGGSDLTNASYRTDSDVLAGGLFDSAQTMDEKDIPDDDRFALVLPAQYFLLAQNTKYFNKDWTGGGNGDLAKGKIGEVAGFPIIKTNLLPQDNYSSVTGEINDYSNDNTNVAAITYQKGAVGTVKLRDMKVGSDGYEERYQGTLMVAKYLLGHGILRPECAVILSVA